MALIDDVHALCRRLDPLGWGALLFAVTRGQLDIRANSPTALAKRLRKTFEDEEVDRSFPGFEDFAQGKTAGITPGSPARSLLFHALASPGVLWSADDRRRAQRRGAGQSVTDKPVAGQAYAAGTFPQGHCAAAQKRLAGFASLGELVALENYIFAARKVKLKTLYNKHGRNKLSIVVFSSEYRSAKDTCSLLQADMVFSRTGISRVGTASPLYDPARRGFWPEDVASPFAIRVCPCRYNAYLAVKVKGDALKQIPMRYKPADKKTNPSGDDGLDFWQPIHKLFSGTECLAADGIDLTVILKARHVNEKIRRIHAEALGEQPEDAWSSFPFRFSDGIAEWSNDPDFGPGLLVPVVHPRLLEPARVDGDAVTFTVPKQNGSRFAAFEPHTTRDGIGEVRPCPAYVHARTEVAGNNEIDLNEDTSRPDVRATVQAGGYSALHYVDFTADGEITVQCDTLTSLQEVEPTTIAAYSLVSAPDFVPSASQRAISEWTLTVPESVRGLLWAQRTDPLCDMRLPANLQLPQRSFECNDKTITAIVPLWDDRPVATIPPPSRDVARHSQMPDDAAGIFAPGWDVAHDVLVEQADGQDSVSYPHLASYGLGSPFPEDAKLCAALSAFWPAVSPDVARTFLGNPSSRTGTVAAQTDQEIGQIGGLPWDGITGPTLVREGGQWFVEGVDFFRADYVRSALENRFSIRITARLTLVEYQQRVLTMALVHNALDCRRNNWFVLSFQATNPGDPELQQAQSDTSVILSLPIFRVDVCRLMPAQPSPADFRRRRMPVVERSVFFVSPDVFTILRKPIDAPFWTKLVIVD